MAEYSSNILTAHVKEDYIRQMISLMKNQRHGISKKCIMNLSTRSAWLPICSPLLFQQSSSSNESINKNHQNVYMCVHKPIWVRQLVKHLRLHILRGEIWIPVDNQCNRTIHLEQCNDEIIKFINKLGKLREKRIFIH